MKDNPFDDCLEYETCHFILREIAIDDSEELFRCYSDPVAARFFNGDNCGDDFFYEDFGKFKKCVKYWVEAIKIHDFFRYSIVNKLDKKCIGTVEMCPYFKFFVGEEKAGILRVDIMSRFETYAYMSEIYSVLVDNLYNDFKVDFLITKAVPDASIRLEILKKLLFENASHRCNMALEHYYMRQVGSIMG